VADGAVLDTGGQDQGFLLRVGGQLLYLGWAIRHLTFNDAIIGNTQGIVRVFVISRKIAVKFIDWINGPFRNCQS